MNNQQDRRPGLAEPSKCSTTPQAAVVPERLRALALAVLSLSRQDRAIYLAVRLDQVSYADIARATGLSERQIAKSMRRSSRRIDRHLQGNRPRWLRWWPF